MNIEKPYDQRRVSKEDDKEVWGVKFYQYRESRYIISGFPRTTRILKAPRPEGITISTRKPCLAIGSFNNKRPTDLDALLDYSCRYGNWKCSILPILKQLHWMPPIYTRSEVSVCYWYPRVPNLNPLRPTTNHFRVTAHFMTTPDRVPKFCSFRSTTTLVFQIIEVFGSHQEPDGRTTDTFRFHELCWQSSRAKNCVDVVDCLSSKCGVNLLDGYRKTHFTDSDRHPRH